MHSYDTLNTLVFGHYILGQLICLVHKYFENVQPPDDRGTATKYSAETFIY